MLETVLIVLMVLSISVLAVGIYLLARSVNRMSDEMVTFLQETRTELVPAIKDLRQVLQEVDYLTVEIKDKVQRVDGVITNVEKLVEGKIISTVASKALSGSKITAVSVLEGIRQGLKTFRGAGDKKREESGNEPQ